jgi:hypothetical protein
MVTVITSQLVDRDPWYWSKDGQREIQKSLDDVKQGHVKRFKNAESLIEDLNS